MSEEISSNDTNLYTTEDAFEQFQAISSYEEEDFITLSDILPPQSPEHNPVSELDDVPYDNEVVLPAFLEQPQDVSGASASCIQGTDVNTNTVAEYDAGLSALQSAETLDQPAQPIVSHERPKRGRKKRDSILTPSAPTDDANNDAVDSNLQLVEDSESIDQPTQPIVSHERPKRGRKKRESILTPASTDDANNVAVDNNLQQDENSESITTSVRPRRGRKPKKVFDATHNSINYTDNALQVENSKTRGRGRAKRGRPKKQSLEGRVQEKKQTNSENGLNAETSSDQTGPNDTSANVIKKRSRRSNAQKKQIYTDIDNATEDSVQNSFDVSNLDTTNSTLQDSTVKVPKRTRKKKVVQKRESDDDDDDISLSQIKKICPKFNGDENSKLNEPIAKVIPQELGVKSQLICDPSGQDGKLSELLNDTQGDQNQMILDSVNSDVEVGCTDMEIDIIGTEETKFFPIIPNTNLPENLDFESVIQQQNKIEDVEPKNENECDDNNLLVEDTTKRPVRRKAKKTFQYDEGSDEDPFANVELSDDEPKHRKKGTKYYSDDEYVPGKKESSDELSDSDIDNLEGVSKPKRKRGRISISHNRSPRKKTQVVEENEKIKPDVETITPHTIQEDDIEECLQTSVIKAPDEFNQLKDSKNSHNSEFENFLAQKIHGTELKIKKVSSFEPLQNAPLEIPVLDPNEIKKTVETSTQTNSAKMETIGIQTSTPYDVLMKKNITLSANQSEKACEFLKSVVKTTAELGQLMTQKSEDFIVKKINTEHVTDTLKMDYCIRKSFLLFKLAKHNLMQMEEDLSKQYEEFLKENNLEACREKPKEVVAKKNVPDSDSDCEIVEETKASSSQQNPKFNPKTVFLNKELSIKIAKKPSVSVNKTPKKQLNIKGRHSVWINDSVMVKKVKPTQSFLAQDSRNKKPPDTYVTEKMVSDFFEEYTRRQTQQICAPFTSREWLTPNRTSVCSYYFVKSDGFPDTAENFSENNSLPKTPEHNVSNCDVGNSLNPVTTNKTVDKGHLIPESLSALCTRALQKYLQDPYINCHQPLIENGHNNEYKVLNQTKNPKPLFQLCVNALLKDVNSYNIINQNPSLSNSYNFTAASNALYNALSLQKICSSKIIDMCSTSIGAEQTLSVVSPMCTEYEDSISSGTVHDYEDFTEISAKNEVKSLFSMCVEWIQKHQQPDKGVKEKMEPNLISKRACIIPDYLKHIAFETVKFLIYKNCIINVNDDLYFSKNLRKTTKKHKVKQLADICFEMISKFMFNENEEQDNESVKLTINSINTLSEEAYLNIDQSCLNTLDNSQFLEDDDTNYYEDNTFEDSSTNNFEEDDQTEESNWVSKLQMKELMSCLGNERNTNENQIPTNDEVHMNSGEQPTIVCIKTEPEEVGENVLEPAIVKTEPLHQLDEMTVIPDGVFTKQENEELSPVDPIASSQGNKKQGRFDLNSFEDFVQSNKIIHAVGEYSGTYDDIFSQSGLRVRRQYEPDSDNENIENDPNDLLVAQTFEPLTIETAKDHLMESSSDEDSANKKATDKKKPDKRGRGRPKKSEKQQATKEKAVPAAPPNEVARLTKRMREKIRQEEKKVESSDSDRETLPVSKKKDKTKSKSDSTKNADEEIQCSNVDSTEQLEKVSPGNDDFPGFSAVDQNEIMSYQKYVKFVYDKIMPKDGDVTVKSSDTQSTQAVTTSSEDNTPLIHPDEPVEMLECEPTMPIFEEEIVNTVKKKTRKSTNKQKTKDKTAPEGKIKQDVTEGHNKQETKEKTEDSMPPYTERDGWKCYRISSNEIKLYQNAGIILEKLPESFVQMYFKYQNISVTQKEDEEVNRLINLNTLKRSGNVKDGKIKHKQKGKEQGMQAEGNASDGSRAASPANSDRYDELTPSEDEANMDDELPPPAPKQVGGENNLAKNLLMGDSDSDVEHKVKREPNDESETPTDKSKKRKISSKSKSVVKTTESPENLMLTADKMMNKELNLLHAPVVLDDQDTAQSSTHKDGPVTRQKNKVGSSRYTKQGFVKNEDDSSSEEEKQWVSTKEKLLKRMGRKDTAMEDDAKRAKLVTEFIERRGDDSQKRRRGRGRPRKSSRALLEREKQLRVLSKEMMSEGDARLHAAKPSQSYFKGRRNIRKVIDKKSLQRSTVIANMEEFERKCRLNQRQARLREILGCEEDVNVVVMNDELCLEYNFEEQQTAVSVHPFFTKVMKAHQYEGVKFMWDACFESLEKVESGHKGGGCILAHCMGLGKTLQVLALLHTVLTHPRVGIQRVLVCCPLSTVLNWVDEIHKWIGPVTDQIKVFELSKLKKTYERAYQLEDWYNGGGIFIIGYELFRSLSLLDAELDEVRPTIVNKIRMALLDPGPDIVICDEGHLLKNDCSVLAVAMSRVQTRRRIVLTGTPMQNNLREYYCMVNFVKPNLLGTYSEYSNRFENPIMNGQHRDSGEEDIKLMKQRTHILHKVLEGCLQRQEASVLYPYLPKKHEYTVFISLTQCQWDLYKHYMHNYANQSKQSVLKDFHILQKIWSHPQVLHNFLMRWRENKIEETPTKVKPEKVEDDLAQEDLAASSAVEIKPAEAETWWLPYLDGGKMLNTLASSNKFVAVFRILDECIQLGDKVLIFSTSLITMDTLEFFLKKINKWSLGQEYYRLDGSVPAEVRQKWCREYNAENNHKTKLFLISTRAGCLGLNMVAANRVIILDTSWNPAHDIQSIFRVYRFGQKKDCYIYRLVALGTMEQKIYERSVTKQAIACRVVDEQQIDRHYNMAELTELYKYDEQGVSVAGGVAIGVEDVALLRVARVAAVHAVHEHDSLLRGSSEQALEEHERNAAWMQFQQEQTHKQIQNHLTPMPPKIKRTYTSKKNQWNIPPLLSNMLPLFQTPEINTEDQGMTTAYQPPTATKSKRGRKPIQAKPEQPTLTINDMIVHKIMNILIRHNYQQRQGPKEISELVASVREIVAFGKVPPNLGLNQELTQSIADILMGRDSPPRMAPLTDLNAVSFENAHRQKQQFDSSREPEEILPSTVNPASFENAHSQKQQFDNSREPEEILPSTVNPASFGNAHRRKQQLHSLREPEEILPSTSSAPDPVDGRKQRRAAVAAKMQIDSLVFNGIIDLDDDACKGGSDTDEAPESASIQKTIDKPKPKPKTKKSKQNLVQTEKQLNSEINSILLSDDEGTSTSKTKNKTTGSEEVVPLHPSLLSNKNFIKIVAHTYLEGNPMLDEDAATLAAQYSTLKALKEYESTGRKIESGPIYDIATKVLGIDILKKLNKSNPVVLKPSPPGINKPDDAPSISKPDEIKKELQDSTHRSSGRVKPKGISELMAPAAAPSPPPAPVPAPQPSSAPVGPARKRGRPLRSSLQAAPANAPVAAPVVPVGLIKMTDPSQPVRPIAPVQSSPQPQQFAPPAREESILPDDDDVIFSQPINSEAPNRKNSQPLILNSVLSANTSKSAAPVIVRKNMTPRIQISSGNVVMTNPATPVNVQCLQQTTSQDTICLDSDEEESITPNLPTKRVALKSTAKRSVIATFRAEPQQAPQSQSSSLPPNCIVIPAAEFQKIKKLPMGVIPLNQNVQLINQFQPNVLEQHNLMQQGYLPQNMNLATSLPQNINMMGTQNLNLVNPQTFSYAQGSVQSYTQVPAQSYTQVPAQSYTQVSAQSYTQVPAQSYTQVSGQSYTQVPTQSYTQVPAQGMPMMSSTQSMPLMSTAPTRLPMMAPSSPAQNNPQSILPTPPEPEPAPMTPQQMSKLNKTVCKPGDILRITKSGQVEILNREEEPVAVGKPAGPSPAIAKKSTTKPPIAKNNTPSSKVNLNKDEGKKSVPEVKKTYTRSRKISSSSSSSSSESSRPSSPEPEPVLEPEPDPDDPLSILRDVVHIRAADEDYSSPAKKQSTTKSHSIGNTSITKSKSSNKSSTATSSKNSVTITPSKDKVLSLISQTDSMLKQLNSVLASDKKTSKTKVDNKSHKVVGSVDLTDADTPATSSSLNKSSRNVTVGKKASSSPQVNILKKSTSTTSSGSTSVKVVGKSSNIILRNSGGKKQVMVVNERKETAPPPAVKKRVAPAPAPAPPDAKKKKNEPMTLKDFDIDDIDDIIELD